MKESDDLLALTLEYNTSLPQVDLHGLHLEADIDHQVSQLIRQNAKNKNVVAVRIIYGRGGSGLLRDVALKALRKYPYVTVHEESASHNGSCLAIFNRD